MRIIIVGGDKAAMILADKLVAEAHDVIVIDKSAAVIDRITDKYSVGGVVGSGASREILLSAGADSADAIIGMTDVDEINLLACSIAKSCGTKRAVACVERPEFVKDCKYIGEYFDVDVLVDPKNTVADEIVRQLCFNSASRVDFLFGTDARFSEIVLDDESELNGLTLIQVRKRYTMDFLIVVICRGDKLIAPRGDTVLEAGDIIGIVAGEEETINLLGEMGCVRKPVKKVMIIGGGDIAVLVAGKLKKKKVGVRIVESDRERCEYLQQVLPSADIIYGSGIDSDLLTHERIDKSDAVVSLTGSDDRNLLSSLISLSADVGVIIARIETESYEKVLRRLTLCVSISTERMLAGNLLECFHNKLFGDDDLTSGDRFCQFSSMMIRMSCFYISKDFRLVGEPLSSPKMRLKQNMLITALVRNGKVIIPKGSVTLEVGDYIIVFAGNNDTLKSAADILA